MVRIHVCGVLLLVCLLTASMPAQTQTPSQVPPLLKLQEIVPPLSNEPLVNPGMGLYLFGTRNPADMPPDAWFSKLLNIGYFRDDWALLEPDAQGQYKFDEYFKPIFDLWVKQWGKRVAFRFMSSNMHSQRKFVTPSWVFAQGVPSVRQKGVYVDEQIVPVFWDEKYLAIQERFIADLGKYLDGRPGLEFIDIGSIGEWGEMHLSRWTPAQLQQTGYTETKYIAAYRRIIDAFARAFPHTRVFLNVGSYAAINDYAALRGLHFRQDGLNPSGPSANVGKRFYQPYARRGVICNYELFSDYKEMQQKGWGVRETFDKGLEDPISYLHINLMGYRELQHPPAEVRAAVTDAARRIGFRFVLSQLRCNQTLRVGGVTSGRLLLESTWKNTGVAPCYDSYALRWTLLNEQGQSVAEQLVYPDPPTTLWWPGETVTLHNVVAVPLAVQPGRYHLRVAMVKPEEPGLKIQLGIGGADPAGSYEVGQIAAEKSQALNPIVYEENFETGPGGWDAAPGMTVRVETPAHSGKNSLLVTGTQPGNAWGYAQCDLKTPLLPASRYRLSCWMKVDSIAPANKAPYLKVGLTDGQHKWIANFGTNPYNLQQLGTWQQLSGFVETSPDTAGGQLAIEKGDLESKPTVSLRLDDVRLELLESP
ncbi:MAG: carbohydrate binding domain-containing protein [Abitibacteriaceae bacterium]|nr:carbohydrate binding domain-containing protein [Abditibacteriaceae bacterium]